MMTPDTLLAALRAAGFRAAAHDGHLAVGPRGRLTDEWRAAIRAHRDGLLALLAGEAAAEAVRPFLDLPPPDDPSWVPAGLWGAFWGPAAAWNAGLPQFYKDGRPKRRKKKPVDALALVRARPAEERLVWDEGTKRRALAKLLEEEEEAARG